VLDLQDPISLVLAQKLVAAVAREHLQAVRQDAVVVAADPRQLRGEDVVSGILSTLLFLSYLFLAQVEDRTVKISGSAHLRAEKRPCLYFSPFMKEAV